MWPFRQQNVPAAVPEKPRRMVKPVGPVVVSDVDLIRDAIPKVFQRKHSDIVPESMPGASMDGEIETGGAARLPDIYSVSSMVPGVLFSWYAAQSFIGHQACAILAQHWLIAKACGQAPKDAAQNGFKPVITLPEGDVPPELVQKVTERNREMAILTECYEACRNSRIFGIRHVLFLVDGIDYEAPFNPDGVQPGKYQGITQIDPYWLTPVFESSGIGDPAAPHFYEPTWWRLPNGQRVHRSHFVILREEEVPDVLKPTYYYGGIPLPQQIYERVYAAERTANEAPELALTKRLVAMTGSVDNFLTDENEVTERLHAFNKLRSNFGFLIIGEDEDVRQIDTALADFDALIMTQYQLVAAQARTPATKLLGTSPKGFNATGEHESDSYDQELVSIQASSMTPLVDRHHLLLCRSEFAAYPGMAITADWCPVRAPKPMEVADIDLKKAQASQTRVAAGIISPSEEREKLKNDPEAGYAHLEMEEDEFGDLFAKQEAIENAGGIPVQEDEPTPQELSLNGAQVASMVQIVSSVAAGTLPRESGVQMLLAAFPITSEQAEKIMGEVGRGFTPSAFMEKAL